MIDVVVTDRKALAAVKIGDQVRLDYTDAVAISPAGPFEALIPGLLAHLT